MTGTLVPGGLFPGGRPLASKRIDSLAGLWFILRTMPTYEYSCSKCDQQFDLFQSITASAIETCPKDQCKQKRWGKGKVKRVIGAGAGLIFKGTGFYITDYRSENYKEGAKKDSSASAAPASTSTESKAASTKTPAPKKESKPAGKSAGGKS